MEKQIGKPLVLATMVALLSGCLNGGSSGTTEQPEQEKVTDEPDQEDPVQDNPVVQVDTDGDGYIDEFDVFPNDRNAHADFDGDGTANAYEPDVDGDGVDDIDDLRPFTADPATAISMATEGMLKGRATESVTGRPMFWRNLELKGILLVSPANVRKNNPLSDWPRRSRVGFLPDFDRLTSLARGHRAI